MKAVAVLCDNSNVEKEHAGKGKPGPPPVQVALRAPLHRDPRQAAAAACWGLCVSFAVLPSVKAAFYA